MKQQFDKNSLTGWRKTLFEVIFEADTGAGKLFDVVLMLNIIASVIVVMLYSVESIRVRHGDLLRGLEWAFTILFTIEYILRLVCVNRPLRYAFSFFGIVDLLAILPTYLSLVLPASSPLAVVRLLRVLRVFRVLKFGRCLGEANMLMQALMASRRKIFVFMFTVLTLVVILGSLIYVIEGQENGFTSIPRSVYWAIVTLTTVGYGDISPQTPLGQLLASFVMIMGYAIIAVPTGIITVEMAKYDKKNITSQVCPECTQEGHDHDAEHCKFCGAKL
ncbi:MAG: ion transporter [Planctomycetes bacterium]|nr:ion transporter [Planctomycetota bacterium]